MRYVGRLRNVGLAVLVVGAGVLASAEPALAAAVRVPDRVADRVPERPALTESDIAASNEKIRQAYGALALMWSAEFKKAGTKFVTPAIVRYRGNVRTECGVMPANNAQYCPSRNAIFFDEVFVAGMAKAASNALGTDGDMAAVGVIAHEMGHAVAIQLGETSEIPYENEAAADCLAGAFAQRSERDGSLEKGDLDEAFWGMASAGDPTPQLTGYRRLDQRIMLRAAVLGHGTREQRLASFRAGYSQGAGACVETLRS
ncbi:MAG: neutral zinc metallopeptidase [bacterium]